MNDELSSCWLLWRMRLQPQSLTLSVQMPPVCGPFFVSCAWQPGSPRHPCLSCLHHWHLSVGLGLELELKHFSSAQVKVAVASSLFFLSIRSTSGYPHHSGDGPCVNLGFARVRFVFLDLRRPLQPRSGEYHFLTNTAPAIPQGVPSWSGKLLALDLQWFVLLNLDLSFLATDTLRLAVLWWLSLLGRSVGASCHEGVGNEVTVLLPLESNKIWLGFLDDRAAV